MNTENYLFRLFKVVISGYTGIITILGIILNFIVWIVKPNDNVSTSTFVIISSILCFFLLIFIKYTIDLYMNNINIKPKVLCCIKPTGIYKDYKAILLIDNARNYPIDAMVTVYSLDNEFEQYIGIGRNINIQENGKVQLLISYPAETNYDWNSLLSNQKNSLQNILVKPMLTVTNLEVIQNDN